MAADTLPSEPSVGLFVNYRNPEMGLVERCVDSLREQEYGNWRAYLCDDASDAGVQVVGDSRIVHRRNCMRLGMVANSVYTIAQMTEDIVVQLDGDDCLYPRALNYIVDAHVRGADLTWGSCEAHPCDGVKAQNLGKPYEPTDGGLEEFSAPQPRSFRRTLFLEAWERWGWKAFTHRSGKQWPVSGDIAIFYPLLRLAKQPTPISEIIYFVTRSGRSHDKHPPKVRAAIIAQAMDLEACQNQRI